MSSTATAAAGGAQRLPVVELKSPQFAAEPLWRQATSLRPQRTAAAPSHVTTGQPIRFEERREAPRSTPRTPRTLASKQQLHREASQITMATQLAAAPSADGLPGLDGRHLTAGGRRRRRTRRAAAQDPDEAAPAASSASAEASSQSSRWQQQQPEKPHSTSLPFVRRHLRAYRSVLELTLGRDRLVVDAFQDDGPSGAERLVGRLLNCKEPTPGEARILLGRKAHSRPQPQARPPRYSRREQTAQTISRAILTYERSL